MYELIIEYGMLALGALIALLTGALTRYVLVLIANTVIREALGRLWNEIRAAVLEVGQTYVDALREGKADGKLTDDEKAEAKRRAIAIAKSNFGKKGIRALARVIDVDEWIGNKIEAVIGEENQRLGKRGKLLSLPAEPAK